MNLNKTYKWSALSFVLIFCLYIVGLPIVISACPMMAKGGKMTCCADTPINGLSIKAERDTSCCKVVIAAKPTTTEFVSSSLQFIHLSQFEVTPLAPPTVNGAMLSQFQSGKISTQQSPVTEQNVKDICILTSSLVI